MKKKSTGTIESIGNQKFKFNNYSEGFTPVNESFTNQEPKTFGEAANLYLEDKISKGHHDETWDNRKVSEPNNRVSYVNKLFKMCSDVDSISESYSSSVSDDDQGIKKQNTQTHQQMKSNFYILTFRIFDGRGQKVEKYQNESIQTRIEFSDQNEVC